jgi:hypothetical protein
MKAKIWGKWMTHAFPQGIENDNHSKIVFVVPKKTDMHFPHNPKLVLLGIDSF